ncbi:I78 family peptidase inhibitor [Paracoccus sp. MBLB3053]|uniref:I78 family peptidase inhibitor n=1 Tax=Paracoccus aurantius TaxID=3073814 RepID=A0ABU2HTB5_9RHOB|nr:I78 family peptidase inhibitor [Paracoccus sp. MBLB3053]MDS9468284.1 I78 family peptidase inhibitor [Paracoccus sp. MBLB3053]
MKPYVLLLPLLAAACVPDAPDPDPVEPPPRLADDTCGANTYLPLIGQTSPNITVPANTPYRTYRTGDPVTMDYNMKRLNFEHDKSGRLVRVSCG